MKLKFPGKMRRRCFQILTNKILTVFTAVASFVFIQTVGSSKEKIILKWSIKTTYKKKQDKFWEKAEIQTEESIEK